MIVDSGFILALKCVGDRIVSAFKSTIEDEKGSGIKHSKQESASLWRRNVFICDGAAAGGEGICRSRQSPTRGGMVCRWCIVM